MIDAVQILWSPAGVTLSALDPLELVDVTDGDTPNLRMPVRMLLVDTPEVTARTDQRAQAIDQEFAQLAEWIGQGRAPISRPLAEFLLPKLTTGRAGRLPLQQGRDASSFAKQRFQERLTRPIGRNVGCLSASLTAPLMTTVGCWPMSLPTTASRNVAP
jgi:hypothetical protein